MTKSKYIHAVGIQYRNELNTIKKRDGVILQPIYEAFMNAWEAIVDRFTERNINKGVIGIRIYQLPTLLSEESKIFNLEKIEITDNGIGLDDKNFERLTTLRDDGKNHSNKGTGRIQFIHTFEYTHISSIYHTKEGYRFRKATLSKCNQFLSQNAFVRIDDEGSSESTDSGTVVTFTSFLLDKEKEAYNNLSLGDIKDQILKHFLSLFCEHRECMPKIEFQVWRDGHIVENDSIETKDIPKADKEEKIIVNYSKLNELNKIVNSENTEELLLRSFKRPASELDNNSIFLVSKGANSSSIRFDKIQKKDQLYGYRYLILLSGKYIDNRDSDDRGNIALIGEKDFRNQNENCLFPEEVVLLETIEDKTNDTIGKLYPEFEIKNSEKNKNIEQLQTMFLLNEQTIKKIRKKIKNTDDDETILQAIYEADSKIEATKDSEIKRQIESLNYLTPSSNTSYQDELKEKVDELLKVIPIQNRNLLCKYVARRKLVLELFERILDKELISVAEKDQISEKLLHNLIFQQGTNANTPDDNDLWLINEEYIYYKGTSEVHLDGITIDGNNLIKQNLDNEELAYKNKGGKDAGLRRPDILLFPSEGKCIIIEFKAPDVDVSNHLQQINRYARLINNLSDEKYRFHTFFGYLVGERGIDIEEILDANSDFVEAEGVKYIYRPYYRVPGKFGRQDGSLYTEIIKYSDILKRAKIRNKIFIDKLLNGRESV